MGCDGPLSSDEDYSHFLDGCVYVCVSVLAYVCIVLAERLFHNTKRHEIVPPCREPRSEKKFNLPVEKNTLCLRHFELKFTYWYYLTLAHITRTHRDCVASVSCSVTCA